MQEKKSILEDFAGKVRKGWSLSEKQESWLNKMLAEAQDIRVNGVWHPSDELKADLEICLRLAKTKNGWFWSHKPGAAKAYNKVESYMDGSSTRVDEWACTKFINTFKTVMKELKTLSMLLVLCVLSATLKKLQLLLTFLSLVSMESWYTLSLLQALCVMNLPVTFISAGANTFSPFRLQYYY